MRAGGCTVQQTLTAEAAGVVKHAVALARRRGHAQVTPLHVAATLLAPGTSVLRRACMKSHPHSTSHPLQCRALELCFNVALNRLPTAAGPLVQGQPSLSNALVAALKRAQAHQRRGCLEQQQQQPLLAVKVEMEQLIISILDDPSVSRVMREAGFSSTFVKNNLEETVAVFPSFDPKIKPVADHAEMRIPSSSNSSVLYTNAGMTMNMNYNFLGIDNSAGSMMSSRISTGNIKNEDIASVMKVLLRKGTRRNPVIVGDCWLSTENVVRELMMRVEGGDVPEPLRLVRFVSPQFSSLSLRLLSREDVEHKLAELRRTLNICLAGGSAIIYAGDLKWAADRDEKVDGFFNNNNKSGTSNGYCPVEHIIRELGRILVSYSESQRLWLMATATYQTFMRCKLRHPSLETLWGLHAAPIPSGGLSLTLQASSTESRANDTGSEVLVSIPQNIRWAMPALKTVSSDDDLEYKLNCCSDCSANFEREAQILCEQDHKPEQKLPLWLQQCKHNDNNARETEAAAQVELNRRNLRKKWNQTCRTKHSQFYTGTGTTDDPVQLLSNHRFESQEISKQHPSAPLIPPANVPWWSTGNQFFQPASRSQSVPAQSALWINSTHQLSWSTGAENCQDVNPKSQDSKSRTDVKTALALGLAQATKANDESDNCPASALPRTFTWLPYSLSESVISMGNERGLRLRQSDPESLKEFCKRLSEKVPWQSEDSIRAIASTVFECKSGMLRRQGNLNFKTDSWLLILGPDRVGKRKIAKALAETIFGSQDKVLSLSICMQNSPNARSCHQEPDIDYSLRGKTYVDRLAEVVSSNPHSVVLLEEIEQADKIVMAAIVNAMERGKLMDSNGREVSLSDSIILMTSNIGSSKYSMNSARGLQFDEEKLSALNGRYGLRLEVRDMNGVAALRSSQGFSLKRKAEWDHHMQADSQSLDQQKRNRKSLFVALDLNLQAQDPELLIADHDQDGSLSGNSDVSQETLLPFQKDSSPMDQILACSREHFSDKFFKFLDKCIVFQPYDFGYLAEFLLDKLESSYITETNGRGTLEVESSALEHMVSSCWEMGTHDQLFEKWVEEIFEVGLAKMLSMHTLTSQTIVKLSTVAENNGDCFFYANSSLPSRLEVHLNVAED